MSKDNQVVFATSTIILELQTGDKSFNYLRAIMPSELYDDALNVALNALAEIGFIEKITVFIGFDNSFVDGYRLLPKATAKPKPSLFENQSGILGQSIEELQLTVRSLNCLRAEGIKKVGDLVLVDEGKLLKMPHMGKRSVAEIKNTLEKIGLHLGMSNSDIADYLNRN